MRLGVFGGSFDPVHYGHLLLAECAREQCRLDRILFVPAAVPPHKQDRRPAPGPDRAAMLDLAAGGHGAFAVSRYEIDRGGVNYTVDTLRHFHAAEPAAELFFLAGADMLHDMPHWREAGRVLELATPVVVRRPGAGELDFGCLAGVASTEQVEAARRHVVEMPLIGLSSTEIRRRVGAGLSIRYQTPRAVEKYIEAQALYAPGSASTEGTGPGR